MTDKELPEAPASVTYSITTKDGYNALFTIRDVSGLGLLDKMATIEKKLAELEYKPQVRQTFAKKEVEYVKDENGENMVCPKCGKGNVKIIHAKTGKTYYGCTNSIYNKETGKYDGCDFFSTVEPKTSDPIMDATN